MTRLETMYYAAIGWIGVLGAFAFIIVLIGMDGIFGEPRRRGPKQ